MDYDINSIKGTSRQKSNEKLINKIYEIIIIPINEN